MRTFLVWLAAAPLALAQEAPTPPAELAKLDRLLGSWESSGVVHMGPADTEGVPWTGKAHTRRAMGGHFLRTDSRIDVQAEQPFTLGFVSWHGYDRETSTYVVYDVSNMGTVTKSEIQWLDDDRMISYSTSAMHGAPQVERWITTLGEDRHEFVGEQALGDAEWYVHVKGTSTKLDRDEPVSVTDLGAFDAEAGPEMQAAAKVAGAYEVEGWFVPMPGAPKVEITGSESIEPIFDGTVLLFRSRGEPGGYEGWNVLAWNPMERRYDIAGVNSMGHAALHGGWREDDTWIFTHEGRMEGTPMVVRSLWQTDAAGKLTSVGSHGIFGDAAPYEMFHATYEPAASAEARPAAAPAGGGDR